MLGILNQWPHQFIPDQSYAIVSSMTVFCFFQGCRIFRLLLLKWSDRVIVDRWLTGMEDLGQGEGGGSLLPRTSARSPLPQSKWRPTPRRMSLMRLRMLSGTLYLRVISISWQRRWTLWIPAPHRSRSYVPSRPTPWGLL